MERLLHLFGLFIISRQTHLETAAGDIREINPPHFIISNEM